MIVLMAYLPASQGTFVLHRIRSFEDPEYRADPRFGIALLGLIPTSIVLLSISLCM